MSRDDDLPEWFAESSNSADDRNEPRHLEAVAGGPESDDEWFDQAEGVASLEIKKRGVDVSPDELRKRLALRGDEEGTLVMARIGAGVGAWLVEPLG